MTPKLILQSIIFTIIFTNIYAFFVDDFDFKTQKQNESIDDIFDDSLEEEARLFDWDRGAAFNTSVAFNVPIFSFHLPGAIYSSEVGIDPTPFGVLGVVSVFLVAGLGVAAFTTAQASREEVIVERSIQSHKYFDNRIERVYDLINRLPDALNVESCTQLSVCAAHAESEKFGLLSWPFKFFVPARINESNSSSLTSYEKAAIYGTQNSDECLYEYPCVIQPLNTVLFLRDFLTSKE